MGKTGAADTPLRPAGRVTLDDGKIIDVVTDGQFIERGVRVVVTKSTSTRIVVTRAEPTGEASTDGADDGVRRGSLERGGPDCRR